jgi:hypothetical protein
MTVDHSRAFADTALVPEPQNAKTPADDLHDGFLQRRSNEHLLASMPSLQRCLDDHLAVRFSMKRRSLVTSWAHAAAALGNCRRLPINVGRKHLEGFNGPVNGDIGLQETG